MLVVVGSIPHGVDLRDLSLVADALVRQGGRLHDPMCRPRYSYRGLHPRVFNSLAQNPVTAPLGFSVYMKMVFSHPLRYWVT